MTDRSIAFLGGGRMAEALVSGLLRSGGRSTDEILVTCRREERAKELTERHGVAATLDNAEACRFANVLVLMAKPQDFEVLLEQIADHVTTEHLVISFAAGIRTSFVEQHLAPDVHVVRVMSNVPVMVDEAMSVIAAGHHADDKHLAVAEELLELRRQGPSPRGAIPRRRHRDERLGARLLLPAGRGDDRGVHPARVCRATSRAELIIQTMLGSAKMLRDTGTHPVELREMVTSPGGTTIEAIRHLEEAGVRAAFLNAIDAARKRSEELARGGDEDH